MAQNPVKTDDAKKEPIKEDESKYQPENEKHLELEAEAEAAAARAYSIRRELKSILNDVENEFIRACFKVFKTDYKLLKLFLIVFILLSTSLAAFLVIETILSFLNFEVNTTTRVIHETSSSFPKITLCNYNPFTTEYSVEYLRQVNQQERPDIDMFNETQLNTLDFAAKSALFTDVYTAANMAMMNMSEDEQKKLGHTLQDIMISCSFNYEACDVNKDFEWKFDSFFGNCYVFNWKLPESKRSYIAGSLFGLTVQFYVGFNEKLKFFNSNGFKGAYVRIENNTYMSDDILDNGIYIPPGAWTTALINRVVNYVMPKPYSYCDLDNESGIKNSNSPLLNLFYHSPYLYTQQSCIIQCLQMKTIEMCNCTYPLYLSLFEGEDKCITSDQLECYNDHVWAKFLQKNYVQVKFVLVD